MLFDFLISKMVVVFTAISFMLYYHYTLYYYDQGGNLVQTVPPAGFDGTSVSFGYQWSMEWNE